MAGGSYLGVDNGGVVCRADFEHAALFELECWDDEQVTIRFVENGKLLTVEDVLQKGQEGLVTAAKMSRLGGLLKKFSILRCTDGRSCYYRTAWYLCGCQH